MSSGIIFLTVPIGNLADLTHRVLEALQVGTKFIVEDSRVFLSLLSALNLNAEHKEWVVWHDHSDQNILRKVKSWIKTNEKIYVVSDAGSPVLSDPAYDLLLALQDENFILDSYGGVTSVVHALELSRLPPIPFHFHGFLARSENDVKKQIQSCLSVKGTHIYFVSPHRVLETVDVVVTTIGDNTCVLARELTKKFQEVLTFKYDEWQELKKSLTVKGEFVLLFHLPQGTMGREFSSKLTDLIQEYLTQPKPKVLAKIFAEITGENVSDIYQKMSSKNTNE